MAVEMLQHSPDFLEAYLNKHIMTTKSWYSTSHPQIRVTVFYPDTFFFALDLARWISIPGKAK